MVKELNLEHCTHGNFHDHRSLTTLYGYGPVEAIPKALKMAGLSYQDIGLVELNEAFAAQSLAVLKNLPDLDPTKVNVNGGAIALGHPLGCTGAILSIKLFCEMRRQQQKYGMVSACIGGGQESPRSTNTLTNQDIRFIMDTATHKKN